MDSSSKLYSTSTSKPMGEAVNFDDNNNNSNSGMISTSSTSSSSRNRSKEMENISYEMSKYPRDLLQTFMGSNNNNNNNNSSSSNSIRRTSSSSRSDEPKLGGENEEEDDEGLNLGLGLSLGGIFGVDKSKNMGGLIRSSSIAGTMHLYEDDDMGFKPPLTPGSGSNLVRTSSLPVETEEEWRKRKEMQTLRRMHAKRRRSEKQKVLKESGGGGSGGEEKGGGGGGGGVEGLKLRARLEREQQCLGITSKLIGSSMGNLFGSPKPPPSSTSNNSTNINYNSMEVKGRRTTFGSLQGFLKAQAQDQDQDQAQSQSQSQPQSPSQSQYRSQYQTQSQPHLQPRQGSSQGSEGSQGASSDASELESKPHQGSSSCGEARSPGSIQSQQDRGSQESFGHLGTKDDPIHRACGPEVESLSKKSETAVNKRKETAGSSGIEDMPCVFTIGDGPHGRKVEGILYKYGKGEDVRIMCVCHGNFFSPLEFVKHAGGKDVEHPLRHIVVSPSTSAFQ